MPKLALLLLLVACPSRGVEPVKPTPAPDDSPLRIRIAKLEALRGGGIAELTQLARNGEPAARQLAIRGLGRIGGPQVIETLVAIVREARDPALVAAAGSALGIAASLDDSPGDPAVTKVLVDALATTPDPLLIEGIGRAADPSAQEALLPLLGGEPAIARAAAIALGRYGRRKLELTEAARTVLVAAGQHRDPRVRYAVSWALAREQLPVRTTTDAPAEDPRWPDATRLLATLAGDPDSQIRAQAIAGLARRKTVRSSQPIIIKALGDADWRVAVEAVRALAGDGSDDAGRAAVAARLPAELAAIERDGPRAQIALEALKLFGAHGKQPEVAAALAQVVARAKQLPDGIRGWAECLAQVAIVRATAAPSYAPIERCGLPDHLKLALLGDLIGADVGDVAERRRALRLLLAHADVRVRGTGLVALAPLWKVGDANDQRAAIAAVSSALASKDALLVGYATEAAGALYEQKPADRTALDAAVVTRARNEREADLAAPLFDLIGKHEIASGLAACRAGLAGHPIAAKSARECLVALGEPAPEAPAVGAATPPPVDVATVIGKQIKWHLLTTRGEVTIALQPHTAPWAVAAIVALTRKGFYDGLLVHRVVPDFVAQGGDPTGSGSGGPGFMLPAEPATGIDPGFITGGVGIADSGRDSGGSQWFVMHAPAPHLDGRYTWIGAVVSGQKSLDSLVIGDRVTRAIVEVTDR
ncbi:MAG TPA: peptidylprolyl isomerase [Kofleriaceae bacterium]